MDLNSDLGESFGPWPMGDDAALLEIVTSANVACGFHAGDPVGILQTLRGAAANGVAVGAHVGYRDLVGFGRRNMDPTSRELIADVIYQIGALQGLAAAAGTHVGYVKPHGALYNTIVHDARQAADVISAILELDPGLVLMGLAGSSILQWAQERGLRTAAEAFADRAYTDAGTLVSRREPGAVLHDPAQVAERMLRLVETGEIETVSGKRVRLSADSICVHGDSPDAVAMARHVRERLQAAGVELRPFVNASAAAPMQRT
ncbi:LamB/YcsF family protein [Pseudothauera nasutitermitis]|uniref:5-oxoprolinase subunit A n=1 Tax=Pseudothauera nasutitermitis TaxID=2565930 RepID=A0A4S4B2D3_9RHOO|nr:5-oxoprolinase subunit PxpA [Pseudothauera nasutitermitis]THF65847.1 LamB/YcsF family protein [Pseudothauera nasutitermitis]